MLLEYLSFVNRPLSKNEITEQFRDYLQELDQKSDRFDSLISKLARDGLLDRRGGKFSLAREIWEEVSAHAAEGGRAQTQCEIAMSPKYPRSTENSFVKARRLLYTGQEERLLSLLEKEEPVTFHSSEVSLAKKFLEGMLTTKPLKFFPQNLAEEVALEGLDTSLEQAQKADHLFHWANTHGEVADYHLLVRGKATNSPLAAVMDGDLRGMDALQVEVLGSSPYEFDHPIQEFIYIVGCFAQNFFDLVEERVNNGDPRLQPLWKWFWEIRTGKKREPDRALLLQLKQPSYPPLMQYFQYMLLYWAGFEEQLEPGRVFTLASRYEETDYALIRRHLEDLYHVLIQDEEWKCSTFLGSLRPAKLWETTLTQLEQWKQFAETTREETPEERIAWQVNLNSARHTVTARIQKKNKSGRWSKGRVTPVEELKDLAGTALDERDEAVLSAWQTLERYQYGKRSHSQVLRALVKHPRLFDSDGEPLEMVEGSPRFVVGRKGEDLFLQIIPRRAELEDYGLLPLSKNRVQLVVYDRQSENLLRLVPREGVSIPESATDRVQDLLTTVSQEGLAVESCFDMGESVATVQASVQLKVRLYPKSYGLRAEVGVEPLGPDGPFFWPGEGERYLMSHKGDRNVQVSRNLETELELFTKLTEKVLGFHQPEAYFSSPPQCLEMLEALREFPAELVSVQWPHGKKFALKKVIGSSALRLSVQKDREWFAVKAELSLSGHEELELSQLLEKSRQQDSRFIELDDGSYVALTRTLRRQLKAIEDAAAKTKNGSFLLNPLTSLVLLDPESVEVADDAWLSMHQRLAESKDVEPQLPEGFEGELRPYQRQGFDWLIQSAAWGAGVCLADDMGLGKTVQILAALLYRSEEGPALVVAPTSVCNNWREEAERFTPTLNVKMFSEEDRDTVTEDLGPGDLLICSYGLMCRSIAKFKKRTWSTVVLDESQAIKNSQTQRFKACIMLDANFRIAATGTPVENHLGELWALFRFLNPGYLGAQKSFLARYGRDDSAMESLKKLVSPFLLRRLKKDVLKDLPPKTDITITVDLSREEKVFYESLRLRAVEKIEEERSGLIGILAELMRLRRACCHPQLVGGPQSLKSSKLERFFELIDALRDAGHRALVFSQFVDHLKIVRQALEKRDISYQYLDGSTPTKKRTEAVKAFQDGEGDLFLISLKAGGTGLNLTAANYVLHLDPWWNPATEDQASDRAHRIGQDQAVTVYRLIGKDTIEEKILALHKEKRELVDNLLAGTDRAGKLSSDELLNMLRETTQLEPALADH